MPRIARPVFSGVPHHITQRGNRREDVFFNEADRAAYLVCLGDYCAKYKVRVLAYCLMTNHIHVVAVPGADQSLERTKGDGLIFRKDFGILIPRSVFRRNKPCQERHGSLYLESLITSFSGVTTGRWFLLSRKTFSAT